MGVADGEAVEVLVITGTGVCVTIPLAVDEGEGGRIGWIELCASSMSMGAAAAASLSCWCASIKIHLRSCAIFIIGAAAWGMQIPESLFVALMHRSGLDSAGLRTGWPRASARCTERARSPAGMSCMMAEG